MSIKISVIGKSGVGKSTFSELAQKFFEEKGCCTEIIKLSEPLYTLQHQFYEFSDCDITGKSFQDQILMENIANILRGLNPYSLVSHFSKRMNRIDCEVIINDDLRDPYIDGKYFLDNQFSIIRIEADESIRLSRLKNRNDISRSDKSSENINLIPTNFIIKNNGDLTMYKQKVHTLLEEIYDINRKRDLQRN